MEDMKCVILPRPGRFYKWSDRAGGKIDGGIKETPGTTLRELQASGGKMGETKYSLTVASILHPV